MSRLLAEIVLLSLTLIVQSAKHDHDEPFVGDELAKEMEQLTPEQTKAKLEILIKAIDKNKDGFTDEEELKAHIKHMQKRYLDNDITRSWSNFDAKSLTNGKLSWDSYKESLYGKPSSEDELTAEYRDMVLRDESRWKKADTDGDGFLNRDEYGCFLHPESCEHMKDVVVEETLKDMDRNGDSMVDLEEYINDMYRPEDYPDQKKEPEWVEAERKMFQQYRDKDKDGKLNADELKAWLMPDDFDHAEAEAKHLINVADDDKDQKLSLKEILDHYETFVGSQVTDYGEQLQKHDPSEL
ncbi:EF hand family protein [Trichuris trichiura]|uniref:Reticulocalbin-3 n=1 Tax=Trichuris trichiura TaxID=36087 RepID=A0A077Z8X9_TRITR|nr:EF hand family protein [Trichuris trichiura]